MNSLKERILKTKEYQKIYQAHYRKTYKAKNRKMCTTDIYNFKTIRNEINSLSIESFNGSPELTCSHFGCEKVLNYREILFGSKCINHSKK
jgi:hypothetical protein